MFITTNNHELVDIRDVHVDNNLPQNERINEFSKQIKDPCHYKCGNIKINAKFANNGVSIEKCFQSLVSS